MDTRNEPEMVTRPLGPAIRRALQAWHQSSSGSAFVALRSFEQLPRHCGFDLDILAAPGSIGEASAAAAAAARDAGLLAYTHQKSERSAKVIWLDPAIDEDHRQWLLLDIGTNLAFGPHRVTLDMLDVETWNSDDFELNIPTRDWRATLATLRGLAASDLRAPEDIPDLADNLPKLSDVVGAAAARELTQLATPEGPAQRREAFAKWRETHGLYGRPKKDAPQPPTARARLSRFMFFRLFYWERHRPPFLVVTGADGVGKTTLITQLQMLLAQYPMDFDVFHHLAATKRSGWQASAAVAEPKAAPRARPVRRLAQLVWRHLLPAWVRGAFVGVSGELRYASRLNTLIGNAFFAGRAALADRYVFDRLTRLEIDRRHPLQQWAGRINCRFMRRPRLAILLSDDPENIHARKDQLSVETIGNYEARVRELIAQTNTPMIEIPVAGRSPAALARDALRASLDALGTDVPALVTSWDRAHRSNA